MNSPNALPSGGNLIVGNPGPFGGPYPIPSTTVAGSSPAVSHAAGVAAVPEPGTLALLAVAGLLAAAAAWRRRRT